MKISKLLSFLSIAVILSMVPLSTQAQSLNDELHYTEVVLHDKIDKASDNLERLYDLKATIEYNCKLAMKGTVYRLVAAYELAGYKCDDKIKVLEDEIRFWEAQQQGQFGYELLP